MPHVLIYIYSSTVAVILLIGFFVLYQNKKSLSNRAFFGLTLFQVIWILALYLGYYFAFRQPINLYSSEAFVHVAYGSGLMLMLALIVFLYYFPRKSIRFEKLVTWLYVSTMIFMAVISTFTDWVHDEQIFENGVYVADSFGIFYGFYIVLLIFSLLLATYILVKKLTILIGLEKIKIVYVATGGLLCGLTIIITNLVLPYYGKTWLGDVSLLQISPIFTLLFIFPTFYSIYKHRFFNFTYVSFHLFRELILDAFFLISILGLYIFFLHFDFGLSNVLHIGLSALLAFLINGKIRSYIPEFVPGDLRALRRSMTELEATILSSKSAEKLQTAIEQAFVMKLNFVNAKLYVFRKNGDKFDFPTYQENDFTNSLKEHKKDALVKAEIAFSKIDDALKKQLLFEISKLEADLFVPLFSEGSLIGFLAMRKKNTDSAYTKEEIDEILGAKRRIEVSLMNILLKMNLEEENNLMKKIINKKTRQLKNKIKQVNEVLKQQADFIAVTAHEFRTPLTIATFQVDAILHSKKPATQKIKELVNVETAINNLKTLTEKLFAVQQYDLNKVVLKLEKVDITNFVDLLFNDFIPIMKGKELKFELKKGIKKKVFANVDQAQFRQVLHNLLTNASKFTPQGGLIRIATSLNKGNIEIHIDDNGEGVPDNLKTALFEKFRTKHAGSGAGIGLGLYLCKKIIALHKGKLWIEDSDLGGASFRMIIKAI